MESSSAFQPTEVPNSQVDPSRNHVCLHQHSVHCFHQYHYHWVYPPFICNHVPVPRCPGHSLPFASSSPPTAISPKTNESLPAHKQPNESPVQSNARDTVSAKQETHNKDTATATSNASIGYQSPRVQCPCFFVPRHPVMHMHAPVCPNHHLLPCKGHGYWQSPCMMPGRPPCLPFPCCPMPHIPSMPSSCPANTVYGEADLNTMEAFPGHAEGELTASHIGAEIWHREGEIQANQDCGMENAYELEEEEEEEEEEEPIFVLTDEWMEFFAKSEARRQQKKKQQQKEAKKLRKAARLAPKKHDGEVEISDSAAHSADPSSSALS